MSAAQVRQRLGAQTAHLEIPDTRRSRPAFFRHFAALREARDTGFDVWAWLLAQLYAVPGPETLESLVPLARQLREALDSPAARRAPATVRSRIVEELHAALDGHRHVVLTPETLVRSQLRLVDELLRRDLGSALSDVSFVDPWTGGGVYARLAVPYQPLCVTAIDVQPDLARVADLEFEKLGLPRTEVRDTYASDLEPAPLRVIASNPPWQRGEPERSLRWASRQVGRGIVSLVVSNRVLHGDDALLRELEETWDAIYVADLRGDQRTAGTRSESEGERIFTGGSRAGTCVLTLVRGATRRETRVVTVPPGIYYASEKLEWLSGLGPADFRPKPIVTRPRDLVPAASLFGSQTRGLKSHRDSLMTHDSPVELRRRVERLVHALNSGTDPGVRRNRYDEQRRAKGEVFRVDDRWLRPLMYRPYYRVWAWSDPRLVDSAYRVHSFWPSADTRNPAIVCGPGGALATDIMPDFQALPPNPLALPRWRYDDDAAGAKSGPVGGTGESGLVDEADARRSNVGAGAARLRAAGLQVRDDDEVFAWVYGALHRSPEAAHVRMPASQTEYETTAELGAQLLTLHLGYEGIEPWPLTVEGEDLEFSRVMPGGRLGRFDLRYLRWNDTTRVRGIPSEAVEYRLSDRSAVEHVVGRLRMREDALSGLSIGPTRDPRELLRLVGQVVRVSIETVELLRG